MKFFVFSMVWVFFCATQTYVLKLESDPYIMIYGCVAGLVGVMVARKIK